jgi:asparagine synthetase B (glutamine-hydrolysing)
MSWILGVIGDTVPDNIVAKIKTLAPSPLGTIDIPQKMFAVAGGNEDTVHAIHRNDSHILINGIGLRTSNRSSKILSTEEWDELLSNDMAAVELLNGHFSIVRYKNNTVDFLSDRVGLRTLYFSETRFGWIFSSRLTMLKELNDRSSISWKKFGSRWLCGQPFSYDAPLTNTFKLPPNGWATIVQSKFSVQSKPWLMPAEST